MLTLADFEKVCKSLILDNGLPFKLQEWEQWIIADLLREPTELHVWVPEANGKTTLAAAIAAFRLLTRRRPRIIVVAASEQQARATLYGQLMAMVDSSPDLAELLEIRSGTNEVRVIGASPDIGLKVIAADGMRAHGVIPTDVFVEELHAHAGLGVYRTLAGKLQKVGGQLVSISTAGEPDSEFELMRTTVLTDSTRSTLIERRGPRCTRAEGPQHIAWNWALDPDDDVMDPAMVKLANPLEQITEATIQAKLDAPGWEEKHHRTFVCNMPTRDYLRRFLPDKEWDAATHPEFEIPEGARVMVGADWGWIDDATAIVLLWPDPDGSMLLGPAEVFAPPRDGGQLNPEVVLARLREMNERNPFDVIAHDASPGGGGQVMIGLLENEFPNAIIVPASYADQDDAAGFFLERLREGTLFHTGDPTLTRHLQNAIATPKRGDPERPHIDRPKESRHAPHQRAQREIDAAIAAVFAVWATVAAPLPPEPFAFVIGADGIV